MKYNREYIYSYLFLNKKFLYIIFLMKIYLDII